MSIVFNDTNYNNNLFASAYDGVSSAYGDTVPSPYTYYGVGYGTGAYMYPISTVSDAYPCVNFNPELTLCSGDVNVAAGTGWTTNVFTIDDFDSIFGSTFVYVYIPSPYIYMPNPAEEYDHNQVDSSATVDICQYCNGSRESQKWNTTTRFMDTIPNSCSYCCNKE